ncbi:PapB/FocB family fimbrial expression transcriptional regulator [Salmonella enterica subsp. enterica]
MMEKSVEQAWLSALLALFCQQKALVPGQVDVTTFRVLAELARVKNLRILNALEVYLVQGVPRERACSLYDVDGSYFSRRLSALNRVFQLTEILKVSQENTALAGQIQEGTHDTQSGT